MRRDIEESVALRFVFAVNQIATSHARSIARRLAAFLILSSPFGFRLTLALTLADRAPWPLTTSGGTAITPSVTGAIIHKTRDPVFEGSDHRHRYKRRRSVRIPLQEVREAQPRHR